MKILSIKKINCKTKEVDKLKVNGIEFCGALGKMKVKGGLRDAFVCPEGYVWLNADYSSEEIALMANFSGEPNLINPLLEGNDIHNYIAKQMFGFEDPSHRTKVKTLNFAVNYGGSASTISNKLGCTREEGQQLLDHYNSTLSQLTRWKLDMYKEARRKGMVFTYFGRPRVLFSYYNSSNKSDWALADRSAVNSPIQGCLPSFTRVLTRHGYVPIVNLLPGEDVWNGLCWTPAEVIPKGPAHLVKVVTADGNVLWCDDRHKLKCSIDGEYKWVDVHDILNKDVCINNVEAPQHCKGNFTSYIKGYITSKLHLNSIPSSVWSIGAKKFLKGFYAACKDMTVYRTSCSFLEELSVLINQFGFNTVISTTRTGHKLVVTSSGFKDWLTTKFSDFVQNDSTLTEHYHLTKVTSVEVLNESQEMYTLATLHPLHQFVTEGFISKNTGGDLIRIDHVKLLEKFLTDKEFADNCLYACTVHDEINLFVKPQYLKKAYDILVNIMYFHPSNFKVPIKASPAVGVDWGHLIDCEGITEDNKLILDKDKVLPLD